ncbi:unnamed protein product [Acanthoscelides obtectus]|uniref:BOP1 N-terminal domain-containing protein n=1 Tax=Acanthoscelides obtectus TaxID=200917 RepID=A0A9P0Q5B5_ACAOB|nr:unnamed protein product [Acanthoscelides obtectus]CAK1677118.1 Ribosome biogenesis protein BOP1 homolog [Acanthoscelides obtectus]
MGNKQKPQKNLKRKVQEAENKQETEAESSEEEDFLNAVNGEEEDSSDSDRELEDSEDEDNELFERQSEASSDSVSEDSAGEAGDSEEDQEEDDEGKEEEDTEDESESSEDESGSEREEEVQRKKRKNEMGGTKQEGVENGTGAGNIGAGGSSKDEYADCDTSDEEDIRNTVGNIPMNWYDEYRHLGYDWDGDQILKPETGDHLDAFLKRMEDPDFWRTVKDPQTGQNVVLSEEDIQLIKRIRGQKIPDATFDEYAPWIEWFTSQVEQMPIRKFPEHKRSFLPSKHEAKQVSKLVHALKMGWIKTREEQAKLRAKKEPQFYMLWQTDDQPEEMRRIHKHISAPKRALPGRTVLYYLVLLNNLLLGASYSLSEVS